MSTMTKSLTSGFMLALFANLALPQMTAASERYYFNCDVPPGKFSEWNRAVIAKTAHVSGTIEMIEPRQHERWWPVASVFLESDEPRVQVGLQVILDAKSPDEVTIALRDADPSSRPFVVVTSKWQKVPIAFEITLNSSGRLEISALGKSATVQLDDFEYDSFNLSCSTGEFTFSDIVIYIEQ